MMTADPVSTRSGRQRGPTAPTGHRGHPLIVTQRMSTALAPVIEGAAFAQEVEASAERMQTFAGVGSRQLLANEAGRIGRRATRARAEFARMAAALEPRR